MRFGSTAKVLLKCKLKYYRISDCSGPSETLGLRLELLLNGGRFQNIARKSGKAR